MARLLWKFNKFHAAGVGFHTKKLEMEFEKEVEIERFFRGHPSSANLEFIPEGEYSKKIEIEFLEALLPHDPSLNIWFRAEERPVFTKIIFRNDKRDRKEEFKQNQIDVINKN